MHYHPSGPDTPEALEASVKDVVAASLSLAPTPVRHASAAARLRAQLGHAAHERARRKAHAAGAATEVPVVLRRTLDETAVTVRGRADAVWESDGERIVEEVKTTSAENGELEGAALSSALTQAAFYALALHGEDGTPTRLRITVFGLGDHDRPWIHEAPFHPEAAERQLERGLASLLAASRAAEARLQIRRRAADHLRLPFDEARPGQQDLIDQTTSGLAAERPVVIDAPTGTGKTIAALLPALREALRRDAAVWFLTAKTTQRAHVAATFAIMAEAVREAIDVPLHAVVLRRKDAMCPPGHLRCHPAQCDLLARFESDGEAAVTALAEDEALVATPEAVFERGVRVGMCPYELMHGAAARADLVVGDYHHGYDARSVRAHGTSRRLLVVDEAHNLPDRVREASSELVLRSSLGALTQAPAPSPRLGQMAERLSRLAHMGMDKTLARAQLEPRPTLEGRMVLELAEGWSIVGLEASILALRWAHARFLEGRASGRDPALEVLENLAHLGELVDAEDEALVGFVCSPEAPEGIGVGVRCVDPASRLAARHRGHVNTVMVSATLHPTRYFIDELGLGDLDPVVASAPSPFPGEHRCVCIVPTIRTRYQERGMFHGAVADLIADVIRVRPGNYAVYFSSFSYLESVQSHLAPERLGDVRILAQPPKAPEPLRAEFIAALTAADRPTLLLAVAGGVFAEGIDLPGQALIGAIVVGPCLPGASFDRQLMQAWYDDKREGAGFAYAFAYPGMQRVVQAAGRVHRTAEDVGIVVLVGERFLDPMYVDAVPPSWWDHTPEELVTETPAARLAHFWETSGV